MRKIIKCICLGLCLFVFFIVAVSIFSSVRKYKNRIGYIEDTLNINISEMVDKIEGSITPEFLLDPDTILLKVTVKKGYEDKFLSVLSERFGNGRMEEIRNSLMYMRHKRGNEIFTKYVNEIENSDVEHYCLAVMLYQGRIFCTSRCVYIFTTRQGNRMVVYFLDQC